MAAAILFFQPAGLAKPKENRPNGPKPRVLHQASIKRSTASSPFLPREQYFEDPSANPTAPGDDGFPPLAAKRRGWGNARATNQAVACVCPSQYSSAGHCVTFYATTIPRQFQEQCAHSLTINKKVWFDKSNPNSIIICSIGFSPIYNIIRSNWNVKFGFDWFRYAETKINLFSGI